MYDEVACLRPEHQASAGGATAAQDIRDRDYTPHVRRRGEARTQRARCIRSSIAILCRVAGQEACDGDAGGSSAPSRPAGRPSDRPSALR
jgi:hypothetical protein